MERMFWLSWTVPYDVPDEAMCEAWPEGMRGWRSGEGHDYAIWCGIVFAADEDAAWATVKGCYDATYHDGIGMRIEPTERERGWEPSDRFVGAPEWIAAQWEARRR